MQSGRRRSITRAITWTSRAPRPFRASAAN